MVDARKWLRQDIGDEVSEARLGDSRRRDRLQEIARAAESSPGAGFPQMVDTDGELEGIYRFFGNDAIGAQAILEPHIAATFERAKQAKLCVIAHDTTAFEFSGERDGLGLMRSQKKGFFGHFALAVLPGSERIPLGVCGLERISRQIRKDTIRKRHSDHTAKDPTRESLRWTRLLESIESQRDGFECIHVMDREGDMYDLMALALRLSARFVIRGGRDRALANEQGLMEGLLEKTEARAHQEVKVSARKPKRRELIAPRPGAERKERIAKLSVGSHVVEIRRPKSKKKLAEEHSIKFNLVHVWESKPPRGEAPIEWVLFTTEPIDTPEQLLEVVAFYRSRWIIEEFFKALKTGCAFEKRQLESFHALSNALAVFAIVAWRMLLTRAVTRTYPNGAATTVLAPTELQLIRHRLKLPKLPTTPKEALYAVARLGGHLKRNGDPGWLTLGRGFEKLLFLQAGWNAALAHFSLGDPINP
ncbi:MAG TPA: IS4 family transposase [Opitutaceae bacterium]